MNRLASRALPVVVIAACGGTACVAATQGFGAFGDASGPSAPRITDAPLRPTIATSATFGFSGTTSAFECSIDSARYLPCASPVTYTGLKPATHTFRVRGRDSSGNAGDPAQYTWQIVPPAAKPVAAGVVPRPVMVTVPVKPWISRKATFAWDTRGAPASQCSFDHRTWRTCVSPKSYTGLKLGSHVFAVRGANGSQHSSANEFNWTITPASPPAAPVLGSTPDANTTSTEAVFTFAASAGMAFECSLDSSGWQPCSSPVIYVGLSVGRRSFCVRAVSPTGTRGLPSCTTWVIETGPPAPTPPPSAFAIAGDLPGTLVPGRGRPLPVGITNPLSFPLTVADLVVTVAAGSSNPGCDGASNLEVAQSNIAGGAVSVVVPAGGSVTLPAQGATAPVVTMLDLGSSQDACKGASFTLSFAAMGTG